MTNRDMVNDENCLANGTHQRPIIYPFHANTTTDSNASNTSGNWFRSIPRRIRKFISKQSRNSSKQISNGLTNKMINATENIDAYDHTYSLNDSEEAMHRAASQMVK